MYIEPGGYLDGPMCYHLSCLPRYFGDHRILVLRSDGSNLQKKKTGKRKYIECRVSPTKPGEDFSLRVQIKYVAPFFP